MTIDRRAAKRDAILQFCAYGRTAEEIGARIGIKTRSTYHLLNKLIADGVLERIGKGRRDGPVIYVTIDEVPEVEQVQQAAPDPATTDKSADAISDFRIPNFYNDPFNLTGARQ